MSERGDLRVIYAPLGHYPTLEREMDGQVVAIVGPIGGHGSHPELQDALALLAMQFNWQYDRLSPKKHAEIAEPHRGGIPLLRAALASAESAAGLPDARAIVKALLDTLPPVWTDEKAKALKDAQAFVDGVGS